MCVYGARTTLKYYLYTLKIIVISFFAEKNKKYPIFGQRIICSGIYRERLLLEEV